MKKVIMGVIGVVFLGIGFFVSNVSGGTTYTYEVVEGLDNVVKINTIVIPEAAEPVSDNVTYESLEADIAEIDSKIAVASANFTASFNAGHEATIASLLALKAVKQAHLAGAEELGVTKLVVE